MNKLLVFAAITEAGTGLALLLLPSLVGQWLLGAELTGIAVTVARVAGIALVALAVACWPGPPLRAMVGYSATIALYLGCLGCLAYLGHTAGASGVLLWPAVVAHLVLTGLLARSGRRGKTSTEGKSSW